MKKKVINRLFKASMKGGLSLLMLMSVATVKTYAQNIQVHYDFGRHLYSSEQSDRQKLTVTYETFKADKLGSWFYFVDLDLRNNGASGAYTEVSREFNLGSKSPFAAHVEFNGGLNLYGSFQNAILVGPAYNGHSADYSKTWSVQLLYKQCLKGKDNKALAGVQLTEFEISNNFIYPTCETTKTFYFNPTLGVKFNL